MCGYFGWGGILANAEDKSSIPAIFEPVKVTVDVRDCGAKGDGVTNDTAAFRAAALQIVKAGGGVLRIPKATYIVGEQTAGNSPGGPFYQPEKIISVAGADGFVIEGNGAILKLADGLHYGSFDLVGKALKPEGPFTDPKQQASIGSMIEILRSKNVLVTDLELDGNSGKLLLGGRWGDKGIQLRANGLTIGDSSDVTVRGVYAHHHALDGIYVGKTKNAATEAGNRVLLERVTSEYSGRQGLSWTGGTDLTVRDSKFNHTGRGALSSSPMAGVDVEPNAGLSCRTGLFERCEFIDNYGPGVLIGSGDGGYTRFSECQIWGTTNYSTWIKKPGVSFEGCRIYGTVTNGFGSEDPKLATRYTNCHFEDPVGLEYPACRKGGALIVADAENLRNLTFEGCTFLARQTKALYLRRGEGKVLKGSTVVQSWVPTSDKRISLLRNTSVEDTNFKEEMAGVEGNLYIQADQGVVVGQNVKVDGPVCQWQDEKGRASGPISPTPIKSEKN